jgi:hypothetical protein
VVYRYLIPDEKLVTRARGAPKLEVSAEE